MSILHISQQMQSKEGREGSPVKAGHKHSQVSMICQKGKLFPFLYIINIPSKTCDQERKRDLMTCNEKEMRQQDFKQRSEKWTIWP